MNPPSTHSSDRSSRLTPELLAVLVGAVGLLAYAVRLMPGPGWYDSPELAGVGVWLGIAHPTGYPIYSILGRLSAILFFPLGDPATRVNLLSALLGGATLGVMTMASWRLIGLVKLGPLPRPVRLLAVVMPALVLGTIQLFVEQAVAAEVYTLHTLAVSVLLLVGLTGAARREQQVLISPESRRGPQDAAVWDAGGWRLPVLAAYAVGLGLGNHFTLVLYVPALLLLLWWSLPPVAAPSGSKSGWRFPDLARGMVPLLALGLLGLTVYLLVPIRASLDPPFNWGGADSVRNFLRLVTAAEARGREAQFDPVTVISIWSRLAAGMKWPVLAVALLGWIWAAIRRPRLGMFALFYVAFPLLFLMLRLDILEDALLPVHMMVAMGVSVAAVLVGERLVSLLGVARGGIVAVILAVLLIVPGPIFSGIKGWQQVTPHAPGRPTEFTRALVASVAGVPEPTEEVRGWVFAEDNTTAFLLWEQARLGRENPGLKGIYLLLAREEWYRRELRQRAPALTVPDVQRGVENQPHQVAGRALVEANREAGIPLFVHPVVVPPPAVYGILVPQGMLLRVEPVGYVPTEVDLRRHAAIIEYWSPAYRQDPPALDALGRGVWSYQHVLLGDAWAALGALEPAEIEYRAALRLDPERVQIWFALAQFYTGTRNWARAVAAYEGALEQVPGDDELLFGLARSLAMAGRFAEADSLLPKRPPEIVTDSEFLQLRARISSGLGSFDSAQADLERAFELDPGSGTIQNDLGVLRLMEDDRTAAREAFELAVRLDPDQVEAWSNLGALALQDGRFDDAEGAIRKAIDGGADAPQLRQSLGALLLQKGDLEGAEAVLRENLRLWDNHGASYLTLGAVLEAGGRRQEAISIYETGRMAVPGDPSFARALRRIRSIPPV